jgi:hypothetical protein
LIGKPEMKKPVGRYRRRLKDNIKKKLRETGWEDVSWIHLAHNIERFL